MTISVLISDISIDTNDTFPTDKVSNVINKNTDNEDEIENETVNITMLGLGKVHKYSTADVIELGRSKMLEHNFNNIRKRKAKRAK